MKRYYPYDRLVASINNRINNVNQRFGIKIPLAYATDKGVRVPVFSIEKRNPGLSLSKQRWGGEQRRKVGGRVPGMPMVGMF